MYSAPIFAHSIAWIGSSFYFMWLDAHLEEPTVPSDEVEGELWMVHSGGFYRVDKIAVAPKVMPRTLHWFKWEAGWTGITGSPPGAHGVRPRPTGKTSPGLSWYGFVIVI